MSDEMCVPESKIVLTQRLRQEGRWLAATSFKDRVIRELRDQGMHRREAQDEAWRRMASEFPPVEEPEPAEDEILWPLEAEPVAEPESSPGLTYEDAVADLPTATPKGVSTFAWIASHPKMPAAHEKVGNRVVIINGDDILKTPCGPAPSKEAAAALRQYVNAPDLFWKAWVATQSKVEMKIVADPADPEYAEDEGLVDVEKMLSEIKSRRKT